MFSKQFLHKTAERAVKSFVQGFVVTGTFLSSDGVFSFDSFKGAIGLGIASVLTSLASSFKGDKESPSLV